MARNVHILQRNPLISHIMNIQVSKTFANFINKTAKEMGFKAHAEVVTISTGAYSFTTGTDLWDAGDDYDCATGTCKAIKVSYPDEYYACSRYLTTYGLTNEFRKRGVKDVAGLKTMLRDMIEV